MKRYQFKKPFYTHGGIVTPVLVSFGSVTRVQDDVVAGVVQTRFVPSDLADLAQHPILQWHRTKRAIRG